MYPLSSYLFVHKVSVWNREKVTKKFLKVSVLIKIVKNLQFCIANSKNGVIIWDVKFFTKNGKIKERK